MDAFLKSFSPTNTMDKIKTFLVDDHQVFLDGLHLLLRSADIEVVGTATNGELACDHIKRIDADVVVMDIDMPVMDGITATGIMKQEQPQLAILLLSMHASPAIIRRAVRAGASGYMMKSSGGTEFNEAIRTIYRGEMYLCPHATAAVVRDMPNSYPFTDSSPLTRREMEVVRCVVQEHSNASISELLRIDIRTVETHRRNIMRKLDVRSTIALVKYAINRGWV